MSQFAVRAASALMPAPKFEGRWRQPQGTVTR